MSELELQINDHALGGWTSGKVTLSIDELAHSFEAEYVNDSDPSTGADRVREARFAAVPQDVCTVMVGGQQIIEAYVYTRSTRSSSGQHAISIGGRSVTFDLVKCSLGRGPIQNASLETIAKTICKPFNIDVDVRATDGDVRRKFATFAIKSGEAPFEALSRAARRRGLLMTTENGVLVFERAGARSTQTVLEAGVNMLSREFSEDWSERFSPLKFRGQTRATRDTYGEASAVVRNKIRDPGVIRYRPQVVQQGAIEGTDDLGIAAIHQRNRQAASSEKLAVTVPGWFDAEGGVWRPNTLVRVRDPWVADDELSLLVAEVTYAFDSESDRGRTTDLVLVQPAAYDIVDYPAQSRGEGWGS